MYRTPATLVTDQKLPPLAGPHTQSPMTSVLLPAMVLIVCVPKYSLMAPSAPSQETIRTKDEVNMRILQVRPGSRGWIRMNVGGQQLRHNVQGKRKIGNLEESCSGTNRLAHLQAQNNGKQ
jgi:hypothetical protein